MSALVYGVGTASARYKLSDVGAWLSASARGLVVHANGLAGKVDGKAAVVPQMRGHRIKIVQDGTTVLLVDEDTGVVSRIDPSQLKITTSPAGRRPGHAGALRRRGRLHDRPGQGHRPADRPAAADAGRGARDADRAARAGPASTPTGPCGCPSRRRGRSCRSSRAARASPSRPGRPATASP
ncbi:hypothetical protein LUX57_10980 [Actinomadura madurae]|uniref:hypothetical protein n=1 Tax=Actinomadura madurae TaxID=1993 RepID=UPI0020D20031|nr:hypothetical protein [Actinomadura madurae]MCP9965590.1 hypothetical protein [Actinomadura madurae]